MVCRNGRPIWLLLIGLLLLAIAAPVAAQPGGRFEAWFATSRASRSKAPSSR